MFAFYAHSSDLHTLFYPMPIHRYIHTTVYRGLFARHHTPQSIVSKFYSFFPDTTPHLNSTWLNSPELNLTHLNSTHLNPPPPTPACFARRHTPQYAIELQGLWCLGHHGPCNVSVYRAFTTHEYFTGTKHHSSLQHNAGRLCVCWKSMHIFVHKPSHTVVRCGVWCLAKQAGFGSGGFRWVEFRWVELSWVQVSIYRYIYIYIYIYICFEYTCEVGAGTEKANIYI